VGHGFAESGAAAGDEDALVAEEVVAEHSWWPSIRRRSRNCRFLTGLSARFGMTRLYELAGMMKWTE
jgi:hypothetical protein